MLGALAVVALLHCTAFAQTAVYVKFLTPPHGYTHNLQVASRGGLAVSKEERIYPGDSRHPRFQQDWYQQNPSRPYPPKLYQPPTESLYQTPQPSQYQTSTQNQYNPPPQNQYHPPPQSQYNPPPQNLYQTSSQNQYHPPPLNQYRTPPQSQYLPTPQKAYTPPNYFYSRPPKPFDEYGPPPQQFQNDRPSEETYSVDNGEYYNPAYSPHQNEVTYDPHLITGPQAAQYVAFLFSRGELFFHLIPHERLVLMNQQDRVENNLHPHVLASIRPGHPFFYHR